jgi:hypothetical protein
MRGSKGERRERERTAGIQWEGERNERERERVEEGRG